MAKRVKGSAKADREAGKLVLDYLHRYERNRPFDSSPFPNLVTNGLNGNGLEVRNFDGGTGIAVFSSEDAARSGIVKAQRDYEKRTGKPWYAR